MEYSLQKEKELVAQGNLIIDAETNAEDLSTILFTSGTTVLCNAVTSKSLSNVLIYQNTYKFQMEAEY